jgi:hypothetical protein
MELTDAANCDKCKFYYCKDLSIFRYKVKAGCLKGHWAEKFYGDGEYAEQTSEHQMCEEFDRK